MEFLEVQEVDIQRKLHKHILDISDSTRMAAHDALPLICNQTVDETTMLLLKQKCI